MPDKRVPRSSEVQITPASAEGIAPLNGQPTPADPYSKEDNKKEGETDDMFKEKENENVVEMTYEETIRFLRGEHPLSLLLEEVRTNGDQIYDKDEFKKRLDLVVKREEGKLDVDAAPSLKERESARENPSPKNVSEYADKDNLAFPVDSEKRAATAHAYIHKYWGSPSKKGITATYGRNDFIRIHKDIVAAMKKFNVTHNYLDSLDAASGYKKDAEGKAVTLQQDLQSGQKISDSALNNGKESSVRLSFNFTEKQQVVSGSRNRMREVGSIEKIDGLVATVRWECGLVTTELLASLMPKYSK